LKKKEVGQFLDSPSLMMDNGGTAAANLNSATGKKIAELVRGVKLGRPGRNESILDLSKHSLNSKDVEILVEALISLESPNHPFWASHAVRPIIPNILRIDGYRIGDAGAVAIAQWLTRPTCLAIELSLAAGDTTVKGLEFVETERRDISEKGGAALAKALLFNTTLQVLDLRFNSLSPKSSLPTSTRPSASFLSFGRALLMSVSLTHVDLSGNILSMADSMVLSHGLRRNHSITKLCLAKTRIFKEG